MRDLYLIRHAIAEDLKIGESDSTRKLTELGRQKMKAISKSYTKILPSEVEVLIHSPYVRARETADILGQDIKFKNRFEFKDMTPDSEPEDLIQYLKSFKSHLSFVVVGHEPHLTKLASKILFKTERYPTPFHLKKGGLIHISFENLDYGGGLNLVLSPKSVLA